MGGRVSHWQSGPRVTQRLGERSINHGIKPASPGYLALAVIVFHDLKYSLCESEGQWPHLGGGALETLPGVFI